MCAAVMESECERVCVYMSSYGHTCVDLLPLPTGPSVQCRHPAATFCLPSSSEDEEEEKEFEELVRQSLQEGRLVGYEDAGSDLSDIETQVLLCFTHRCCSAFPFLPESVTYMCGVRGFSSLYVSVLVKELCCCNAWRMCMFCFS